MSTKCTIFHYPNHKTIIPALEGIDTHCFYECLDEDNIYLEIVNPTLAEVRYSEYHKGVVATIAIPGKLWNHLVRNGELKSWGGEDFNNPKTPEERSRELQEGMENTIEMLKGMKEREARKERTQNKIDAIFGKGGEKEDGEA